MKLTLEYNREPISFVMVIVPQGSGDWAVYDYDGPSVMYYVGEYGIESLNDLNPPDEPGVWVWSGWMWDQKYDTLDGPEWDTVTEGTWRKPTSEEIEALCCGRPVWSSESDPDD